MNNFFKKYKIEIGIFMLALIVRVALFSVNFSNNGYELIPTIMGDDGYYQLSQSLLRGEGFTNTLTPYTANPLRPPVWPLIIAGLVGLFGTYWAVAVFEIVIGSVIPVLGLIITRNIFERKWVWLGTGLLMVLEPYSVLLSFILYTETMFTFFFLLFFVFLIRYFKHESERNVVWMTVCMGLATLIKPTIQYIPIALAAYIIWRSRRRLSLQAFGHAAAVLVIFLAIISPWLYRNYREFGVWGISAQPAYNLYVYLMPTVLSIDNGTNFATELAKIKSQTWFDENNINLTTSDFYTQEALDVIKEHKGALVKSGITTVITFFTHDGMLTVLQYSGIRIANSLSKPALTLLREHPLALLNTIGAYAKTGGAAILVMRLFWIAVTLFSFAGVYIYLKKENVRPYAAFGIFLVAYFALTTAINGLGVNARFRVPVLVFILAFALYGFLVLCEHVRKKMADRHA